MGLVALRHVGSSPTRYRTHVPCIGRQILNHWTTRGVHINFLKLFILIGGYLFYNIVVVFDIHQHESATGAHVSRQPESPSHLPPHPSPLGCPRTWALSVLLHAWNSHWSSISHDTCFNAILSYHPTLTFSHIVHILFECNHTSCQILSDKISLVLMKCNWQIKLYILKVYNLMF